MQFQQCRIRRAACFGAVFLLLAAATGCGKGKVSGTVKGPDGQPLPLGRIIFAPTSGPGATADIEDGKYVAQGITPGETKVSVETKYIKDNSQMALQTGGAPRGPQPPAGAALPPAAAAQLDEMNRNQAAGLAHAKEMMAKYREVPEKFTKPDTSGLSLTVKSGDNTFDVDLSK